MTEPWLSIIGMGEDGLHGLSESSRKCLAQAQRVFGSARLLDLAQVGSRGQAWPTPFDVEPVLAWRGRPVVVLASGDPFWYGVGSVLAQHLAPHEWRSFPAPSTFSLAANVLGWPLETVVCLGLHARPLSALVPHFRRGTRLIVLLRDPPALSAVLDLVRRHGFGDSEGWLLQRLGGERQRVVRFRLAEQAPPDAEPPLALALDLHSGPSGLPTAAGLPDEAFEHDGQLTKSPIRALTLRALAPRPGQRLWDLGAGNGSISIEWCLAGGQACAVERDATRAQRLKRNAERWGVAQRLQVWQADILACVKHLPVPVDAVFIGGGFNDELWAVLSERLPQGCRVVINAVSLPTQSAVINLHRCLGGELWHFSLAQAQPLGQTVAWLPSRPIVQWALTWPGGSASLTHAQ